MQLFGSYTSPYVRHCRIALAETGLRCDFVESDTRTSAERSPTQKLPFLQEGELLLTDSCSILRYIREKAKQPFFPSLRDYDAFCLTNTLMDSAANLFALEKDGITPQQSPYLERQQRRIDTSLDALSQRALAQSAPYSDFELRLGCVLDWARFRNRFAFSQYPTLTEFLESLDQYEPFTQTAPPAQ